MRPEKINTSIAENEIDGERLREQAKKIGKKALDESFQQDAIEQVPDDYLTAGKIARELGVGETTINRTIKKLQIKGSEYKPKGKKIFTYFSPDEQRQIRESLDYLISVEDAPEGYFTVNECAKGLGVSVSIFYRTIKELHIKGNKYRSKSGNVVTYFSPDEQQQIRESLDYLISAEEVPDGYLTVGEFTKKLDISDTSVYKVIKELQINGSEYKDKNGRVFTYFSPDEQQQIRESLDYLISAEEVPEGYLTVDDFANNLGISVVPIKKRIKELQIGYYRFKGRNNGFVNYLSPDQQQQIRESLDYLISAEQAPEGYLTVGEFADDLGISYFPVNRVIGELHIECKKYKNKSGFLSFYLSPDQQQQIRESLDYLISTEQAPEGYIVVDELARKMNTSIKTINKAIEDLQIKGSRYKAKNGNVFTYLSPDQQQQIRESLDYLISAEQAPEGYLTINSFANVLGVDRTTIVKIIKKLQIEGENYRAKDGHVCVYFSPDEQQQIRELLDYKTSVEEAPEGYLTVAAFAKKIKINKKLVSDKVTELQIICTNYGDKNGVVRPFLSPDQQRQIHESLDYLIKTEEAPADYLTVYRFANVLGVDRTTIADTIQQLQIEGENYRAKNGNVLTFLSPDQQQQIRESLDYLISTEQAPEGYLTVGEFAKELNISINPINKAIENLQIEGSRYKAKNGNVFTYLSPDQQQQIRESLDYLISTEEAPEGYLTVDEFAKELNISINPINKAIENLQIEGSRYKAKNGNVFTYLSPDQQQQIRESLDYLISAEQAPEGYLTIPKFAALYSLNKNTVENYLVDAPSLYMNSNGSLARFLSPEQQSFILESMENMKSGTSISENTMAFYLKKAGKKIKQGFRPDWLKNPDSGRNLEIDIFVDPPGIGIEYDGCFYHQDVERDIKKDSIAQKSGYRIIHIREDGCPELPEGSVCIKRKNNDDDTDLGECIKECFKMLGIPVPDIDIARDKKDIMVFMRQRVCDKIDSARTFEELSVAS